jgi:hypothetical protein
MKLVSVYINTYVQMYVEAKHSQRAVQMNTDDQNDQRYHSACSFKKHVFPIAGQTQRQLRHREERVLQRHLRGPGGVLHDLGTASVDLTFNVVPAPIDNTTNLTVINRGKNVAKMCQKCGKMWQKCAMS